MVEITPNESKLKRKDTVTQSASLPNVTKFAMSLDSKPKFLDFDSTISDEEEETKD